MYCNKNGITNNGYSELHAENSYRRFDLHYEGDALDEMEEDWKVLEFTAAIIRLKHESN